MCVDDSVFTPIPRYFACLTRGRKSHEPIVEGLKTLNIYLGPCENFSMTQSYRLDLHRLAIPTWSDDVNKKQYSFEKRTYLLNRVETICVNFHQISNFIQRRCRPCVVICQWCMQAFSYFARWLLYLFSCFISVKK